MTKKQPLMYNWVQTCGACPEQYDVYDSDNNYLAYVRLRYGILTASKDYTFGSHEFYLHNFKNGWRGVFPSKKSRRKHMRRIETAIILSRKATV